MEERRDDGAAILRRSIKAASTDALRQAVATQRDEAVAWAEEEEVSEHEPGLVRCRSLPLRQRKEGRIFAPSGSRTGEFHTLESGRVG